MRLQEVRRGRQCVRPEVCRTYNFGAVGASAGQFFFTYLRSVKFNDVVVPWTEMVCLSCVIICVKLRQDRGPGYGSGGSIRGRSHWT